jgi:hypothetical protein
MNNIYTCGYSGHTPEQLKQAAEKIDALVLDIRHMRRSRMFEWNEDNLFRVLGAARYCPLPEWGNLHYKGGAIKLADAPRGLLKVFKLLETHNVILLCGCREYSHCHRRVCAELFHERGVETQELEWPKVATAHSGVVLSIRQPWAWLIANGFKDVENRTWPTRFRGEFFIHAGKSFDADGYRSLQEWCEPSVRLQIPNKNEFELGGIVGRARIVDCVDDSESDWFFGPYGFVIEDAQPLAFRPLRGQLGFFKVSF